MPQGTFTSQYALRAAVASLNRPGTDNEPKKTGMVIGGDTLNDDKHNSSSQSSPLTALSHPAMKNILPTTALTEDMEE